MPHAVRGVLRAAVATAVLLAFAGCGAEEQGSNVDPDQVDAVEAPNLGACRVLTPDDVKLPSNATKIVDCDEPHTAETFAVGDRCPEELEDAGYDDREIGSFAYQTCSEKFMAFLGADESLVMRSVVSWAWFRPVRDGVGRGRPVVPLRRRRRRRPERGVRRPPARPPRACCSQLDDHWMVCANGPTVNGVGQGPVLRGPHLAGGHHDQARGARGEVPGRPAGRGHLADFCSDSVGALAELPDRLRLRLDLLPRGRVGGRQPPLGLLGQDRPMRAVAVARCCSPCC